MRVGILTWYKALNHGAVLQAYASCQMIKGCKCRPIILDYKWNLDIEEKSNRLSVFFNRMKHLNPSKVAWYLNVRKNVIKKQYLFDEFIKADLPKGKQYDEEDGVDAVYIGSDMVFDITEGYNPYMYGYDVPSNYIFSYAASFGYTTKEQLDNYENKETIVNSIRNLKSIGYRDHNTFEICKSIAPSVPMTENIDPVLCYGFEKEIDEWDTGKWKSKKYILIYAYDSTMNDKETVKQIKRIARDKGLKIISCGYYHKWCDEVVCASPKEFVEMIKHSTYVITDTFHGTIFSLIMHKNFASIIRRNGFKLRYLLECSGMEDRIVNKNIDGVLKDTPKYENFDNWIMKEREKSLEFVRNNLERCARGEL